MKKSDDNISAERQLSKTLTKKFTRNYFWFMLIFVLIGAATGIYLVKYMRSGIDLFLFIFFYIAIILHVIIHEAGHLVFGLLTGYQFVSFRVFSMVFIKEDGRIKRKKYSIPGAAGQCIMSPPEMINDTLPYKLYNYGGGIANLVTSIIAAIALFILTGMPFSIKFILAAFIFAGVILGITNIIPVKSMGVANDGYNVKCMNKDKTARKSFHLQLSLAAKQMEGMRLRDMPKEWFELPEETDLTNVLNAYVKIIAYERYLDMMSFTEARKSLDELKEVLPMLPIAYLNIYNMNHLFLTLVDGSDRSEVDNYLTKQVITILKAARKELNIMRIAYAYHTLYTKDEKLAKKCYETASKLAIRYPIKPDADMNMMLIEHIDNIKLRDTIQETYEAE